MTAPIEALTGSIEAAASRNPEPGARWEARSGYLGSSKEGCFLDLFKTKHRDSTQYGVCVCV